MKKETKKPNGYWTKETCLEAAQQCKTRNDFRIKFSAAYQKSYKNGWINDYTWLVNGRKLEGERRTKWNEQTCYEAALQCKTKKEFENRFSAAYQKSLANGWMSSYTWFLDEKTARKNAFEKYTKWNEQTCYEAALQCKTSKEFRSRFVVAYKKSHENGWSNDYTWFIDGRKLCTKWNEETCYEAAKQCKTRTEFNKRFNTAYKKSYDKGWINDYTWFEQQYNGFKDFIYVYEFPNNIIYVGRSVKPNQRDYQHIFSEDSVGRYVKEHNNGVTPKMQIIEECDNATIGAKREQYWMDYYKNNGYTLLNKVKGGGVGALEKGKWNEETCYEAAKQCKTRTEFNKRFSTAYHKSHENGWIEDYTWFIDGVKINAEKRIKWNEQACYEAALQCTTRTDFSNRFSQAYKKSHENGWMNSYTWFVDGKKLEGEKRTKWNEQTCYEAALQCKTRSEFKNKSQRAYQVALENGWLDEFFPTTKQAA